MFSGRIRHGERSTGNINWRAPRWVDVASTGKWTEVIICIGKSLRAIWFQPFTYLCCRDVEEKAWSVGSSVGGEEVCAFNEDDVDTVDKIRLRWVFSSFKLFACVIIMLRRVACTCGHISFCRWQVCDGTEDFVDHRSMKIRAA